MLDDDYTWLVLLLVPLLTASGWFARKWWLARRLRLHGIGKGAPGFQTNVARIQVTPEIAARLRRGEQVSPEEIQRAVEESKGRKHAPGSGEHHISGGVIEVDGRSPSGGVATFGKEADNVSNEWLPNHLTNKEGTGRRHKKKKKEKN